MNNKQSIPNPQWCILVQRYEWLYTTSDLFFSVLLRCMKQELADKLDLYVHSYKHGYIGYHFSHTHIDAIS